MTQDNFSQSCTCLRSEDGADGIAGVVEEDDLGLRSDHSFQILRLETETVLLLQGDTDNLCTQQLCLSLIAGIGGIGDDDFISGI